MVEAIPFPVVPVGPVGPVRSAVVKVVPSSKVKVKVPFPLSTVEAIPFPGMV